MADSGFKLKKDAPVFHVEISPSRIALLLLAKPDGVNLDCLVLMASSGTKIAGLDSNGVITSYVEDPVKEINAMLESGACPDLNVSYQLQAYLLLFRAYFLLPQSDSWKKNPLL